MQYSQPLFTTDYQNVSKSYYLTEESAVATLLSAAKLPTEQSQVIVKQAVEWINTVRLQAQKNNGLDAFMRHYDLSSEEGITLMCLAEALLRIPDTLTQEALLEDKIAGANWKAQLGSSHSWFVNASTWGLMISGRILKSTEHPEYTYQSILDKLIRRSGEPVIRQAMRQAMKIMAHHYILGRNSKEALKKAKQLEKAGYVCSFDMLGEGARTQQDAQTYFEAYEEAIHACGQANEGKGVYLSSGVSIKLSALHPRYELAQRERVLTELLPKLKHLAQLACQYDIHLTLDAEEAARLDLSLDLFSQLLADPQLADWQGLGLAVQAYQKRAWAVLHWLAEQCRYYQRRIMVRLVKGAYWDAQIKLAQENGYLDYPVFTRKANTDVSYLACARFILANKDVFYGQFASHNAHTLAYITHLAQDNVDYEVQRLQGMGEELHAELVKKGVRCRIYAPVGKHQDLLAYLVRRLLENGANSSFVHRIHNANLPADSLAKDPVWQVETYACVRHPNIPLPLDLYQPPRINASGIDLSDLKQLEALQNACLLPKAYLTSMAGCLVAGRCCDGAWQPVINPANKEKMGQSQWASLADIEAAIRHTTAYENQWRNSSVIERVAIIRRYSDLLEKHMPELIALCIYEAGKTVADSLAEVREAVDFCRYYAAQAEQELAQSHQLPAPTGETNHYYLQGRGTLVAISPWNFPLAIFTGQIVAALLAGNCVLAKPAPQTTLIGWRAVRLLFEAGLPELALAYLPGGAEVGARLVAEESIAGVIFTGSVATAKAINQTLAQRQGAIVPFIAETGGLNAMIVDSSALLEQVTDHVVRSAFGSAGQRCSALRLLCVQDEIAEPLIQLIKGNMAELTIGEPQYLATDIPPVIDQQAHQKLTDYCQQADSLYQRLASVEKPHLNGYFVAPTLYEIERVDQLTQEQFGPILHLIRYKTQDLSTLIQQINQLGYGLTFGVQSRIDSKIQSILSQIKAGNLYVNRTMTGAVVGMQPFGGEGLSGTGHKAGGVQYLRRLCVERVVSWDTTAAGGNASLMAMEED